MCKGVFFRGSNEKRGRGGFLGDVLAEGSEVHDNRSYCQWTYLHRPRISKLTAISRINFFIKVILNLNLPGQIAYPQQETYFTLHNLRN